MLRHRSANAVKQATATILLVALLGLVTPAINARAAKGYDWLIELRGVRVETKDGRARLGYVEWNEAWFQGQPRFPHSLTNRKAFYPAYAPKHLTLYTEVYPVAREVAQEVTGGPFIVATAAGVKTLSFDQIKLIKPWPMKHASYASSGSPPVVLSAAARWLAGEQPRAIFTPADNPNELYLSYNRGVGAKALGQVRQQIEAQWQQRFSTCPLPDAVIQKEWAKIERALARRRIVRLIVPGC